MGKVSGDPARFFEDMLRRMDSMQRQINTMTERAGNVAKWSGGYSNGFHAVNASNAGYYRDANGIVHLYGAVATSTSLANATFYTINTLPEGFRPGLDTYVPLAGFLSGAWNPNCIILIQADGLIRFYQWTGSGKTVDHLPLTNSKFKAEA